MRIGNWVRNNGKIVQVKGIIEGMIITTSDTGNEMIKKEKCEPVLLTEKILSRFDISKLCHKVIVEQNGNTAVIILSPQGDEILKITSLDHLQDFYYAIEREDLISRRITKD